jgi:hypothetical protein
VLGILSRVVGKGGSGDLSRARPRDLSLPGSTERLRAVFTAGRPRWLLWGACSLVSPTPHDAYSGAL